MLSVYIQTSVNIIATQAHELTKERRRERERALTWDVTLLCLLISSVFVAQRSLSRSPKRRANNRKQPLVFSHSFPSHWLYSQCERVEYTCIFPISSWITQRLFFYIQMYHKLYLCCSMVNNTWRIFSPYISHSKLFMLHLLIPMSICLHNDRWSHNFARTQFRIMRKVVFAHTVADGPRVIPSARRTRTALKAQNLSADDNLEKASSLIICLKTWRYFAPVVAKSSSMRSLDYQRSVCILTGNIYLFCTPRMSLVHKRRAANQSDIRARLY